MSIGILFLSAEVLLAVEAVLAVAFQIGDGAETERSRRD
jgi:hypothetical protein